MRPVKATRKINTILVYWVERMCEKKEIFEEVLSKIIIIMLHMNNFTHKRDHTRYAALMWYQRCVLISDSRWAEPTFSNAHLTFCMLLLLLQKLCLIFWSAYFLPGFIISCSRDKYHMHVVIAWETMHAAQWNHCLCITGPSAERRARCVCMKRVKTAAI